MTVLPDILEFNQRFVEKGEYHQFRTDRFPDRRLAVVTCMDTRLIELLPRSMGLKNGDAKIIRNAGAVVSHPFGSVMRSLLVAVYELGVQEILIVGHHDCGMSQMDAPRILSEAAARGIDPAVISTLRNAGIDLEAWLKGFHNVGEAVRASVSLIRAHPLLPSDFPVQGLLIDPDTGALEVVSGSVNQIVPILKVVGA